MNQPLMPFTKLVLAVSAIVQTVFGLEGVFIPSLVSTLTWPPPFDPIPSLWLRYDGVMFLAMALGAAYALRENNWLTARTYLVMAGAMVFMQIILTAVAAFTPPGAPPIAWLYLLLAVIYVPVVLYVWRKESATA
jgi:hypothetical protein